MLRIIIPTCFSETISFASLAKDAPLKLAEDLQRSTLRLKTFILVIKKVLQTVSLHSSPLVW